MSSSTNLSADLAALVVKANDAMHFCNQLHELDIDGAKQLKQCKKLFALDVKITHLPGCIQAFRDYHIVQAFTGQIYVDHKCCGRLANPALTAKAKANAAAAEATASSAADTSTAKPASSKGKGKAVIFLLIIQMKGQKSPKSKAVVEDMSDDEPAMIVLVGIKEDTVMGNADASSANPDTDTVSISFLAAIMSIDDKVEIVVNKDLTAGNIVEGHKVTPKFKKSKAKENIKHQQPELMELTKAVVVKAAANEAATQAHKCPRASNKFSFNDSAYLMIYLNLSCILAANLVLNNESTKATLALAAKLVTKGGFVNPSETVLHLWESDLRNNIVSTIHHIEYLMQYCQFVVNHHSQVLKSLERCITAEDNTCEHCPDHNVSDCFSTTATGYCTK
ncbi:hypothetical protein EDD85DRAFT_798551 [Armillaria nabsnona]|nr:hypothetical protein EDD85DRAFT_798551 [Armillaria nabsnona]